MIALPLLNPTMEQWRNRRASVVSSLFVAVGLVLLSYWTMETTRARRFQSQPVLRPTVSASPPAPVHPVHPREGSAVARLIIPDISIALTVVEGTSAHDLSLGPGHISTTPLPGEPGNVGIAGHRDTVFRPLRSIRSGQLVILKSERGEGRYRVVSTIIVDPKDIQVLKPTGKDSLTLVTCYPFYYVGPAPKRFIVRAERLP